MALHGAAGNGHETAIRLLLEHKANVDAKDKDGEAALYRAAKNGHEAVAWLLLDHEVDIDAKKKKK
jgi:ankyrin repeat protein